MWQNALRQILILSAILLVYGCGVETSGSFEAEVDPVADSLNERAIEIFTRYLFGPAEHVDEEALRQTVEDLQRAATFDPTNVVYASNAANLLLALGKTDAAVAELTRFARLNSTAAEVMQFLGYIHEANGRSSEAIVWYEQAIRAFDQRIELSRHPGDPASRVIAIRMARGREAGLAALKQLDPEVEGRDLAECLVRFVEREEIIAVAHDYQQDARPLSNEMAECLAAIF